MQKQIEELIAAVHADRPDQRTLFMAIETIQEYADYLEWLEDNMPATKTEPFTFNRTPEQLASIEEWAQSLSKGKNT